MQFVLLIHEPRGQRGERTPAEGEALYNSMLGFAQTLRERGVFRATESLLDDDRGVRVQVREGQTRLIDGPFSETKEMVGGFFLIDCAGRDEALAIAAECPAARWATVELRPVGPCFA